MGMGCIRPPTVVGPTAAVRLTPPARLFLSGAEQLTWEHEVHAMRTALLIVAFSVGLFTAAVPALAHHSFAAVYDANKPITVKGTITRTDWVNPHSWLYITSTDPDGKVVDWALELGAPSALFRQGWKKTDLPVGAEVTVEGYLARDGSHIAARNVRRSPDRSRLSAGSSGQGPSSETLLSTGSQAVAVSAPARAAVNTSSGPSPNATVDRQIAADQRGHFEPVPAELPAILARVNGEAIERWELEDAIRDFDSQTAGHRLPAEWHDEVVRSLLDDIVADHLMAQEARARQLDVAEADVLARIEQIHGQFPSEDAFAKALAAAGLSVERLQQQTRRILQISKLLEAEMGRLSDRQREAKTDAFILQLKARAKVEMHV